MSAAILVRAEDRLKVSPEDLLPSTELSSALEIELEPALCGEFESGGTERTPMTSPRHRQALLDLIQALQPQA
ncbi:MAG: hypothetical protein ACYDD1_22300 [Caulobacteraceae bacterium]